MNNAEKRELLKQIISFIQSDTTTSYTQIKTIFDNNNLTYNDSIKCEMSDPNNESHVLLKKKCHRVIAISALNLNEISYDIRDSILSIVNK